MPNGTDRDQFGLLYQKDWDSTNFPLTEIKRAIKCFGRRREFAGLEPAVVHLRPDQAQLIRPDQLEGLGLTVEPYPKIPVNYIWLTGRPRANGAYVDDEETVTP